MEKVAMARLFPHAEATAARMAGMLKEPRTAPLLETPPSRAAVVRRLLEELGVRCNESAQMHDLKGYLLSSRKGTEIALRHDLTEQERLEVYAHLVAHALLGPDLPTLSPVAQLEYSDGRAPGDRPAHELREEAVAEAVARAILDGRLEAAPRLVYCRALGPARGPLSRAVMSGLHRGSLALYRRSRSYQRLRSLPVVTALWGRVHTLLESAA